MSRRCKPGQRALVVGSNWNRGQIVIVVRYYFGEDIDGTWPQAIFPWVVSSLGAPLRRRCLETGKEKPAKMVAVLDDCDLEPLSDDDDGMVDSVDRDLPLGILARQT